MKSLLLVGLGGGAGSMLRYGLSVWAMRWVQADVPAGTFAVNVLGSFLIGYLTGHLHDDGLRLLLAVGFCGGFTTFSAFSLDFLRLLQGHQMALALAYAGATLGFCVAATAAGLWLSAQP